MWHSSCFYSLKLYIWSLKHFCVEITDYGNRTTLMIEKIVYCATVHLLVFGISPTSSGLTGLYFGLHKQSETSSVWSSMFTDTCSYKHTLIPHVVVYRPCFHSQRLLQYLLLNSCVFTVNLCRQIGLLMSYTV